MPGERTPMRPLSTPDEVTELHVADIIIEGARQRGIDLRSAKRVAKRGINAGLLDLAERESDADAGEGV